LQTRRGHILFFGLHPTKEILWQSPDGVEARKVIIYLQNSAYLPEIHTIVADSQGNEQQHQNVKGSSRETSLGGLHRVADLCGDAKSLGVVLENGTILSFSWAAEVNTHFKLFFFFFAHHMCVAVF